MISVETILLSNFPIFFASFLYVRTIVVCKLYHIVVCKLYHNSAYAKSVKKKKKEKRSIAYVELQYCDFCAASVFMDEKVFSKELSSLLWTSLRQHVSESWMHARGSDHEH